VISDSHEGIKAAASKVLKATWQRCRVHFMRNALAHAGKYCYGKDTNADVHRKRHTGARQATGSVAADIRADRSGRLSGLSVRSSLD
jgi:transposase-like protein